MYPPINKKPTILVHSFWFCFRIFFQFIKKYNWSYFSVFQLYAVTVII